MFRLRKRPYAKLLKELAQGERYLAALEDEPGMLGGSRLAMEVDRTKTRIAELKDKLRELGYEGEL